MLKPPVKPMLLSSITEPFNSKEYLFEYKWDGFRSIIFINNNEVFIQSRNQKNLTDIFSELTSITTLLKPDNLILDGEICYFAKGKQKFNILQKRLMTNDPQLIEKYPTTFVTWDILSLEKRDIYSLPLLKRKKQLENSVKKESTLLQMSPYVIKEGKKLYNIASENNLEGIVAKKLDSPYEFRRSDQWKKIKIWQYTSVIIVGYTRDHSGLLVASQEKDKNIVYMGKIKYSLNSEEETALFRFLPTIKVKKPPINPVPEEENIIWVKPAVKCKVRYTELTTNNTFRHGYAVKLEL